MIVSEPVIRMENIIKRYYIGKPNELQILNGISLSVDQGEFVSIVGESGSGKSTLMNIIGVLDRQTEGTYFLEGKDVNKMDDSMRSAIRNKRIGFVFQNFNLLPKANALKNVMVPLLYSTEREKNQKERAMEMLKMVGMEERAFLNHMGWSGNMCAPAPYVIDASEELIDRIAKEDMVRGVTIAAGGFFGPQGRELRIPLADPKQNDKIETFEYKGFKITNFEMESSALAGLSRLMGHKAMTVCMVIANRLIKEANTGYKNTIDTLIKTVLDRI